jgi:hypothetical protein
VTLDGKPTSGEDKHQIFHQSAERISGSASP